jgi:hypothetical protein
MLNGPKYTNKTIGPVIQSHDLRLWLGHGGTTQGGSQPGLGLERARRPTSSLCDFISPASTTFSAKPLLHRLTPNMAEQLVLRGTLEGHNGWVTSLATSLEK